MASTTIITDTTAKDYDSIVQSLIDFATSQYGEQTSANRVWTDFNISSFSRNWLELVAYVGDQLMFYLDTQANQAHLATATIPSFILNIAQQFGYEVPTQQAASGSTQFTTIGPYTIPSGYRVFSTDIEFFTIRELVGSRAESVSVDIIQGQQRSESYVAAGLQNEQFILVEPDVIVDLTNPNANLKSPQIRVNGLDYTIVTTPVEAASNSLIVVRSLRPDGRMLLTFGDGVFGVRLNPNDSIQVQYRIQGGSQGNLSANEITSLSTVLDNVSAVTNLIQTTGGVDQLSLQQIKDRIPLSLETKAGAVSLDDYSNILIANFPQVLTAKAAVNTTDAGIDIDIYVIPQADTVTKITDNTLLFDSLTDYLERKKTVTTKFLIRNGEEIFVDLEVEAYLNRDASRASVEADIRSRATSLFDLRTGNSNGSGMQFAQTIKVSDFFDLLKTVTGIDRFEVKRHTVVPRVEEVVSSPNQHFYVSRVNVYANSGVNEWIVATSEASNPDPINGQIHATVFKRTLANVTSVTQDSITDSNLDLTVLEGSALAISNTIVTDPKNVFNPSQYNNYLLIDRNNNIWRITDTKSSSLVVSSPALNDASIISVSNGDYRIVKSFAGQKVAVSGSSFTILYNNRNTFYSPAASFDLITTIRSPFFLSEQQTNEVTYGVPVALTSVTAQGPNPGDLVEVGFNGNPNLQLVDTTFILVDRTGEVFEVAVVQDNDSTIVQYDNALNVTNAIKLVGTGADQSVAMPFIAAKAVVAEHVDITLFFKKTLAPLGNIVVDIAVDNAGIPGTILASSIPYLASTIPIDNFNDVSITFSGTVSFTLGATYHLIIRGDNAYKLSYAANDGYIEVGVDTVTLGYHPATTASGTLSLTGTDIGLLTASSATVTVIDNSIRSRLQAISTLKVLNNTNLSSGTYSFTIGGQTFTAVTGSPGPSGQFQVGGSASATAANIVSVWNAQASAIATAVALGSDSVLFTAAVFGYPGEKGNAIGTSISQSIASTWTINSFGGGVTGDSISIEAPLFLNSGLVSYTYTPSTGTIQFASSVTLPSVVATDYFIDGTGTHFSILGINDGLNTITLDINLTVNTDATALPSGSIYRIYTFEYGDGSLNVGANSNNSASNLSTRINTILGTFATASASANVVTVGANTLGKFADTWKLNAFDQGVINFTLSGATFSGGRDADIIAINGISLTAVSGSPGTNEFNPGITPNDTLLSIRNAILTSPSLTGIVNASVISGPVLAISAVASGTNGNSITMTVVSSPNNAFAFSGPTLTGGQNNLRMLQYNGSTWANYSPDADLVFAIRLSSDTLLVVAKTDTNGNQVIPQISVNAAIDSGLGRRYYSDNGEISFLIASITPNNFIVGTSDVDVYGRGTVEGTAGTRVDQFIFRTSQVVGDVTNLREMEIPVLDQADLNINLLGGVS